MPADEHQRPEPPRQDEMDAYLAGLDFDACETVSLPVEAFDGPLRKAIVEHLPAGAGFCFNYDQTGEKDAAEGAQVWVLVSKPGVTREVLDQALASLGR